MTYSEESGRRACEGILGHGNGTDIFFAGNFSLPLGGRWYVRWALRGGCRLLTTGLFRPLGQRLAGELADGSNALAAPCFAVFLVRSPLSLCVDWIL